MREYRIQNTASLSLLSVICVLFLLASCGKKGEPVLKSYEKPDAPSGLRAIHGDDKTKPEGTPSTDSNVIVINPKPVP